MKTRSSSTRLLHPDAVAQEGPPGEGAGGIDGDDPDGMPGLDSAAGEGGGDRALADARGAGDADPDAALLGGDEPVPDLGDRGRARSRPADQAGAGQPAAGEETGPESGIDNGRTLVERFHPGSAVREKSEVTPALYRLRANQVNRDKTGRRGDVSKCRI